MITPYLRKKWTWVLALTLALGVALILAGCGGQPAESPTPCPEIECPECPEIECPEPAVEIPFEALWTGSGHADATAEAFVHWDADDPAEVPTRCAKCHSEGGYLDFLGVDGTEAGVVDNAAPIGSVVSCIVCHNEATIVMDSVVFPSGMEVAGLGDESRCMQCHQGRASTVSVDEAIAAVGVSDDEVSTGEDALGFVNIHYYAAAATQYGTFAMGGYQYEGQSYDARFYHVEGYNACFECHNPHTLELAVEECSSCHTGVASVDDLKDVRMAGSMMDYDGDGDVTEGIYYEIAGLQEILYAAIQAYAADVAGAPIVYDAAAYPYFLDDAGEGYASWTPRLLRAAYNYQTSLKDPGAFAHGGKYIIQLLYDSIVDLDPDLAAGLHRDDAGHFAGSAEAFRHWDEDGEVESDCSRCHSATGLPFYLAQGAEVSQPISNGFLCTTCHDDLATFSRYAVETATFPSGAALSMDVLDNNLCMSCHQGRESTVSLDAALSDLDADTVYVELGEEEIPRQPHYFAAGATIFGTEAQGAYEYAGRTYVGRFAHVEAYNTCIECHDAHTLELNASDCGACHPGVERPQDIRISTTDYDGDGDTTEGLAGEIATMQDALYAAMQDYAANVAGTPIIFAPNYPYFFIDTDGNGEVDPGENAYPNNYNELWTPRLIKASYNYLFSVKDPGAFAHNGAYILQILYDSLVDIGGDATGMTRP
jgi:hypothetical protein